jgi:hypothetical protein
LRTPPRPLHDSTWWAAQTQGIDFSIPDHLDTAKYNRILWEGMMGNKPYPVDRSGADLRVGRAQLLKEYEKELRKSEASRQAASIVGNGSGN